MGRCSGEGLRGFVGLGFRRLLDEYLFGGCSKLVAFGYVRYWWGGRVSVIASILRVGLVAGFAFISGISVLRVFGS